MAEWKEPTLRINPTDKNIYHVGEGVIRFTEQILSEYGNMTPACEGLVFWGGIKDRDHILINTCIAPRIKASRYNIQIDHYANYKVVKCLASNGIIHIGQVHSHPGSWVDHSETDDEYASFKVSGLLSIVVPEFCQRGMVPLIECGVHRFNDGKFHRLSDQYIRRHFIIQEEATNNFFDLRYE